MRIFLLLMTLLVTNTVTADRIKDLTTVAGVRSNQLIGYGLVVGLNGTGDGGAVPYTGQSLRFLAASESMLMVFYPILMWRELRPVVFLLIMSPL